MSLLSVAFAAARALSKPHCQVLDRADDKTEQDDKECGYHDDHVLCEQMVVATQVKERMVGALA